MIFYPVIQSPLTLRNDAWGQGHYGASRDQGARTHNGVDVVVTPGQPVYSPIEGLFQRIGHVYNDNALYKSNWVVGIGPYAGYLVKIMYAKGDTNLVDSYVQPGQQIGIAQAISNMYGPTMKNHLHIEMYYRPGYTGIDGFVINKPEYQIDPTQYVFVNAPNPLPAPQAVNTGLSGGIVMLLFLGLMIDQR